MVYILVVNYPDGSSSRTAFDTINEAMETGERRVKAYNATYYIYKYVLESEVCHNTSADWNHNAAD